MQPIFVLALCSGLGLLASARQELPDGVGEHIRHSIANEFQLLNPHNIVEAASVGATSSYIYNITSVSPNVIRNDDVITVTYYSNHPKSGDWIGAYSPSTVTLNATVPVKYGYCNEDTDYVNTGSGSLRFNMTNLRADIVFVYFSNGTYHPIVQERSPLTATYHNFNEQLRRRIVPTGDYNAYTLLWSSYNNTHPVLQWGVASGSLLHTVDASTFTINQTEMCGSQAQSYGWRDIGLVHKANFTGMKGLANQDIYYRFGDSQYGVYSVEYIFHVPPRPGQQPPSRPTTVVLFDDLGRGSTDDTYTWNEYGRPAINTSMSVGALILSGSIDAVYHGGDISYATGYIAVWDFYLDMISPMAGGALYLTTVGNHESDYYNSSTQFQNNDSGGECGVMATRLIPEPYPATTDEPWWSYDVGLMHLIGMSTEHNFTIGSKQYLWLENDLKNINRSLTPWVVFGGHRAMYLNSNYGPPSSYASSSDGIVSDAMIANVEPLLYKYRVNIGFYGHNHAVQRQSAVLTSRVVQYAEKTTINGETVYYHDDPQATVHYVVGTGGAGFTMNAVTPAPSWNELTFYQWGYAVVTAVNESYLTWEWINSANNEVQDRMAVYQTTNWNESWHATFVDENSTDTKQSDAAVIIIAIVCSFLAIAIITYIHHAYVLGKYPFNTYSGTKEFRTVDNRDASINEAFIDNPLQQPPPPHDPKGRTISVNASGSPLRLAQAMRAGDTQPLMDSQAFGPNSLKSALAASPRASGSL